MADTVTPEVRSRMMAAVKGKDTKPELLLRKGLHAAGFRFRLHDRKLPGHPDMVFPKHRAALFAHGCFWHGHDCPMHRMPGTRRDYWEAKIARNREVDARTLAALAANGWRHGIVWECALRGRGRLPFAEVIDACATWLRAGGDRLEIRGTT
jgi:DNA mismatch endonuclease, patch repair protein